MQNCLECYTQRQRHPTFYGFCLTNLCRRNGMFCQGLNCAALLIQSTRNSQKANLPEDFRATQPFLEGNIQYIPPLYIIRTSNKAFTSEAYTLYFQPKCAGGSEVSSIQRDRFCILCYVCVLVVIFNAQVSQKLNIKATLLGEKNVMI